MKRLLKQKNGMTLMEILVALTLLMIVIVGTTPVMLSAFDGLYTAGEFTQDTYEAKSEVEDKLATRNTKDIYNPGFQVNFQNIGEVANINARRAVSSLKGSLETLFSNGKVHIAIVSAKNVNDDYAGDGYHEVIIQTSNLDFGDDVKRKEDAAAKISLNNEAEVEDGDADREKIIDLTFIIPNKQKTDAEGNVAGDAEIYTYKDNPETQDVEESYLANIEEDANGNAIVDVDHITGRITVKINGFDFTQSPIKIRASYLDENNKKQVTETYLFIDQPTIMAVGETNKTDSNGNRIAYYTTPGVVEVPVKGSTTGAKEKVFEIYPRTMRTENATGTQAIPENTIFKSVNWITESTPDGELLDNSYASSYYVITGTNGAIYRTYAMTGSAEKKIIGKVNLDTSFTQFNVANQLGVDVAGVLDKDIILADKSATLVYPAFWGADFSHIFGYSAYDTYSGYKGQETWYTQTEKDSGVGKAGYYSNTARYAYYFNGTALDFSYNTQRSKKISYILTELENSLRIGGYMDDAGHFDAGINRIWERPLNTDGSGQAQEEQKYDNSGKGYFYKAKNESLIRSAIINITNEGQNYKNNHLNQIPTYFCDLTYWKQWTKQPGRYDDGFFAQLRLKSLTTYSPTFLYEKRNDGGEWKDAYNTATNKAKVTVTDATYIPDVGVFYVGSVAAYGVINQLDNYTTRENYASSILNDGEDNEGYATTYYVMSNDEGTTTSVYKYSSIADSWGFEDGNYTLYQNKSPITETNEVKAVEANSDASREFFVTRNNNRGETKQLFSDVLFTMGFTSNREMVYSKIVYGKDENGTLKEAYKYCEPLYFLSRYDDTTDTHVPNLYMNDFASTKNSSKGSNGYSGNITNNYYNVPDNDYYNVWFPGEMYNLTKVATKDGVTVAVGYAVSGSTYTWMNVSQPTNTSTALGGIFNDGVLAGMILGQDTSFSSLLYFKDRENFDDITLADGTLSAFAGDNTYRAKLAGGNKDWKYGTHQRDSIQFTTVDLSVEKTDVVKDGTTGEITEWTDRYYAYYADNKGRVFRSLVATKNDDGSVEMVSHIADQEKVLDSNGNSTRNAPSYMEEQKIGEKAIGDYFEKITSVKADGGLVIVTGYSKEGFCIAVGEVSEEGNAPTWKIVKGSSCDATYKVNDMLIRDGYVYIAGSKGSGGFVFAVEMAALDIAANNGTVSGKTATTAGALYAIAGQ